MVTSGKSLNRNAILALSCTCVAIVVLVTVCLWGTFSDSQLVRATLLQAELAKLRTHAARSASWIEQEIAAERAVDWENLNADGWLSRYWQRAMDRDERRLFAAVVDEHGTIVFHSDPNLVGKRLERNWYDVAMLDAGDDVVQTHSPALTSGKSALDVRAPIKSEGRVVGEYHAGFDLDWFSEYVSGHQQSFLIWRAVVMIGILVTIALAVTSLYYLMMYNSYLRQTMNELLLKRNAEVSQLAAGLAHEIRNPLHAVRLNLFTFERAQRNQAALSDGEISTLLDQSTIEIERIDRLMEELVRFATPEEPRIDRLNLNEEIAGFVDFIRQELLANSIEITVHSPSSPVIAYFDSGRLRQIMLNLLTNAQDAMPAGGQLEVRLTSAGKHAIIAVADSGHGISDADSTRVFEPFFTTKSGGTGLGLALVQRFVEDAGGSVVYERNPQGGSTFTIRLPVTNRPRES
mgnify:CR=1 FL=1